MIKRISLSLAFILPFIAASQTLWAISDTQSVGSDDNASLITQFVPNTMVIGEKYDVQVTLRNTGHSTWTPDGAYRLAAVHSKGEAVWGVTEIPLSDSEVVRPGETKTFEFVVTAPGSGSHNFEWQLVRGRHSVFGEATYSEVVCSYTAK